VVEPIDVEVSNMDEFIKVRSQIDQKIAAEIIERVELKKKDTYQLNKISRSFRLMAEKQDVQDIEILLKQLENQAHLRLSNPLISYDEKFSKGKFLARRIIRKLIKWYIEPIAQQQSEYNQLVLEAIKALYDKRSEN